MPADAHMAHTLSYTTLDDQCESSGKQLQPDLIKQINQVLLHTGLDAHSLKLEITESVIIDNTEFATAMLSQLRA